ELLDVDAVARAAAGVVPAHGHGRCLTAGGFEIGVARHTVVGNRGGAGDGGRGGVDAEGLDVAVVALAHRRGGADAGVGERGAGEGRDAGCDPFARAGLDVELI